MSSWARTKFFLSRDRFARFDRPGGIARDHGSGRNILRHHAAGAHQRILAHGDAAQERRTRADGRALFYHGSDTLPVRLGDAGH